VINSANIGDHAMRYTLILALGLILALLTTPHPTNAAQGNLVIDRQGTERQFTAADLLARPDNALVTVQDSTVGRPTSYRAVPLLALLGDISDTRFDTLEARASDGFVAQIPLTLVIRGASGGAVAWLAVEDPAHPWPPLPHQSTSAGPFYLIWEHPERSGVTSEQWPYGLVRLTLAENPVHRWPQLAVPVSLPPDATARRGQDLFLSQCLPCHRLKGGGAGEMGPDLGRPMNPTQYLTETGLRNIVRDPRAVRTWPSQQMPGFDEASLPDADLDAVIAYLRTMAR
jgi:mono/diheme cytochrome c family protein